MKRRLFFKGLLPIAAAVAGVPIPAAPVIAQPLVGRGMTTSVFHVDDWAYLPQENGECAYMLYNRKDLSTALA